MIRHNHVAGSENRDTCEDCGLDLRDDMHLRDGEPAQIARNQVFEALVKALGTVYQNWDGEPEDMIHVQEALALARHAPDGVGGLITRSAAMDIVCSAVADWFDAGQKQPLSVLLIAAINAIPEANQETAMSACMLAARTPIADIEGRVS